MNEQTENFTPERTLYLDVSNGVRPVPGTATGAWLRSPAERTFVVTALLMLAVELLSLIGHNYSLVSAIGFVVTVAAAAGLALYSYPTAMLLVVGELALGSQGGYLFAIGPEDGARLSLRMGLFLALFAVWAGRTAVAVVRRDWSGSGLAWFFAMRRWGILWPYVVLLAAFAWSALNGLRLGNGFGNVFFDANGYAYFALLPAVIAAGHGRNYSLSEAPSETGRSRRAPADFFYRAAAVTLAAIAISVLKALYVLYAFSHRMRDIMVGLYLWVRDTRVGEITIVLNDFYRVFFQSHLFAMMAIFVAALVAAYAASWRDRRALAAAGVFIWSLAGVLMGMSRSFWFGLAGGIVALAAMLVWGRAPGRVWRRLVTLSVVGLIAACLIIFTAFALPYPQKGAGVSLASLLGDRALSLDDEAAKSRWALLPVLNGAAMDHPVLGSGFGKTVTYKTEDPRQKAASGTGEYTTFAFEWGYQDLWLKLGLIGLAAYAWFLWRLLKPMCLAVWRTRNNKKISPEQAEASALSGAQRSRRVEEVPIFTAGLLTGVIALLATNVFSPYLNHPLGIGFLLFVGAWGWYQESSQAEI
ncbi:MAG: O-antigen ligase family protein [Patescibacteria group bacterium]|nr:O-antigen ligase family protein [Patescibacteria group bacterium]